MSERTRCSSCGGLNGLSATFCNQCFAPISGSSAPAVAAPATIGSQTYAPPTYTPYSPPGSTPAGHASASAGAATAPWRPSGTTKTPFLAALGQGMALRVAFALIVAAVSFVVRFVTSQQSNTFATSDGTYELSYSGYWSEPSEGFPAPPTMPAGTEIDLMLESDDAMFFSAHGPAPGPASSVTGLARLNDGALRQALQSAGFGATLEKWSVPGTRDIGGERALFDASGYIEMSGMRADFDVAIDVTDGAQPQMIMFIHSCLEAGCEESTAEFDEILESVAYNEEVAT